MTTTAHQQTVQICRQSARQFGVLTLEETDALLNVIDADWTEIAHLEQQIYDLRLEAAQLRDNLDTARRQLIRERDYAQQARAAVRELRTNTNKGDSQ